MKYLKLFENHKYYKEISDTRYSMKVDNKHEAFTEGEINRIEATIAQSKLSWPNIIDVQKEVPSIKIIFNGDKQIYIHKMLDEWYYLFYRIPISLIQKQRGFDDNEFSYECDQFDGLLQCISDIVSNEDKISKNPYLSNIKESKNQEYYSVLKQSERGEKLLRGNSLNISNDLLTIVKKNLKGNFDSGLGGGFKNNKYIRVGGREFGGSELFFIREYEDEWYTIEYNYDLNKIDSKTINYKCDQLEGLLKFIDDYNKFKLPGQVHKKLPIGSNKFWADYGNKIKESIDEKLYFRIDMDEWTRFEELHKELNIDTNQIDGIKSVLSDDYSIFSSTDYESVYISSQSGQFNKSFYIFAYDDEYYQVDVRYRFESKTYYRHYRCDQFEGLLQFFTDLVSGELKVISST